MVVRPWPITWGGCRDRALSLCATLEGTTGKEQFKGSDDKCPNDKGLISWKTGNPPNPCCEAPAAHNNADRKSFSVSRALAADLTAPLSSGRAARSRRKSQLGYFLFGSVARLPGNQNGHKQLEMELTTTSNLVPFQPFQPGRNKLRHALIGAVLEKNRFFFCVLP